MAWAEARAMAPHQPVGAPPRLRSEGQTPDPGFTGWHCSLVPARTSLSVPQFPCLRRGDHCPGSRPGPRPTQHRTASCVHGRQGDAHVRSPPHVGSRSGQPLPGPPPPGLSHWLVPKALPSSQQPAPTSPNKKYILVELCYNSSPQLL